MAKDWKIKTKDECNKVKYWAYLDAIWIAILSVLLYIDQIERVVSSNLGVPDAHMEGGFSELGIVGLLIWFVSIVYLIKLYLKYRVCR